MITRGLKLDPVYIEKSQAFYALKEQFAAWKMQMDETEDLSLEEARKLLKDFGLTIPRVVMPAVNYELKIFRARLINPDSGEDIGNARTFSYPSAENVTRFQRANAPGHPVFYGALDGKTALEELRKNGEPIKPGDTVFLSEWHVKAGTDFNPSYLTSTAVTEEEYLFSPITKNIYRQLPQLFKKEDCFFTQTQEFLLKAMGELFLSGKHLQSGIIAHEILYETKLRNLTISGLMYPSCANQYRSINCALHPDFVDQHLELIDVKKIIFNEFDGNGAKSTMVHFSRVNGQKITWFHYVTDLDTDLTRSFIELEEDWSEEKIKSARFYLNGERVNIHDYCTDYVNSVDLGKKPTSLEQLQRRMREPHWLILDNEFEEGIAYMELQGKHNRVKSLRIATPARCTEAEISAEEVLAAIE